MWFEPYDAPDRSNLFGGCDGLSNCNSRLSARIHTPVSVHSLTSNSESHSILLPHSGVLVTRVCVQCKDVLGEKCVQCGAKAAPDSNAQGHPSTENEFRCLACSHGFSGGEGGETGGMCEACFDETLRKAHEQQKAGRQ